MGPFISIEFSQRLKCPKSYGWSDIEYGSNGHHYIPVFPGMTTSIHFYPFNLVLISNGRYLPVPCSDWQQVTTNRYAARQLKMDMNTISPVCAFLQQVHSVAPGIY
jgi:hypothetical protein